MDFSLDPELEDYRQRVVAFVAERILPLESDPAAYNEYENIRLDLRDELRADAKDAGLWAPQLPKSLGGLGLPMVGQAAFYEAANRSIFGPCIFNCAAPDDGNHASPGTGRGDDQRERWLAPIVSGAVNSSIVMTEPAPGGGSDPGMIRTPRRAARRQLDRLRSQMVHFRRRHCAALRPDCADRSGPAGEGGGI